MWTIGYGTTMYPNGVKVKAGQRITQPVAESYLRTKIRREFEPAVTAALGTTRVNQNQFDALVSFAYNLGVGALRKSTLLRKVRANPNERSIRAEFNRYVNVRGRRNVPGLVTRRRREADLYFSSS